MNHYANNQWPCHLALEDVHEGTTLILYALYGVLQSKWDINRETQNAQVNRWENPWHLIILCLKWWDEAKVPPRNHHWKRFIGERISQWRFQDPKDIRPYFGDRIPIEVGGCLAADHLISPDASPLRKSGIQSRQEEPTSPRRWEFASEMDALW